METSTRTIRWIRLSDQRSRARQAISHSVGGSWLAGLVGDRSIPEGRAKSGETPFLLQPTPRLDT